MVGVVHPIKKLHKCRKKMDVIGLSQKQFGRRNLWYLPG